MEWDAHFVRAPHAGCSALYISLSSIDVPIGLHGIDALVQPLVALPDGFDARLADALGFNQALYR